MHCGITRLDVLCAEAETERVAVNDIQELIRNIRAWDAAQAAYRQSKEWTKATNLRERQELYNKRGVAFNARDMAARPVIGRDHELTDDKTLEVMVALANRLQEYEPEIRPVFSKRVFVPSNEKCPVCRGVGFDPTDMSVGTCIECGGSGYVMVEKLP